MNNGITYKVEICDNCGEQVYRIRDVNMRELGSVAMSDGYLHKEAYGGASTSICENRRQGNELVKLMKDATEEKNVEEPFKFTTEMETRILEKIREELEDMVPCNHPGHTSREGGLPTYGPCPLCQYSGMIPRFMRAK
mgnify:CR=1 FL=1